MLAIEVLVEEILRLQNLTMYLQAQLQEAKMSENWFVAHPEVMRYILKHERKPLTVLMEDEPVHTDERPFCDDPACGCHSDPELLREYAFEPQTAGLLTLDEAVRLIAGKQL